jgi:hypothetical protein
MKMAIRMTQTHIANGNVQTINVATKRQLSEPVRLVRRDGTVAAAAGLWPLDHCSNRLRVERLATLIAVTCVLQPDAESFSQLN